MRTLIIYDNKGYIVSIMTGDVNEPDGIPFMWVDIPSNKYITGVDVSKDTHIPIFEECQKSEVQKLQEELLVTQLALTELYERMEG